MQLVARLNVWNVLLLESADDALRGSVRTLPSGEAQTQPSEPAQTLGQLVMALAEQRVVRLDVYPIAPMTDDALNAPYPDQGHRAAQRALADPGKPVSIPKSGKNP